MAADASFAIEIATSMGDGENTIAELDALTSAFTGAGKNASAFQDAIKTLSSDLSAAQAAQSAANEALSAGQAQYALLETAALQASKAAERLASKGMTREYLEAAQKASLAEAAVNEYAGTLRVLEAAAEGATKEEQALAQSLANVRKLGSHADKVIAKNAESLSKLGGALGAVGGPLGSIGQKLTAPIKGFSELSGVMGSTNAAALLAVVGVAALAAAVVAAGVAAVFAGGKLLKWAIKLSDKEGRLAEQTDRLSSNFDELFSGLNIEPVIEAFTVLADLFDKNTAAGETLKFLFESIFQPIVDQAANAAYAVEAFYLGFLIGALKLYLALKPAIKTIAELFGFEDSSLAETLEFAKQAGELLAPVIIVAAAAFGALLLAIGAAVAAVGGFVAAIIAMPFVIQAAASAVVDFLVGAFNSAVEFIRGIDFIAIGTSIMQGLAAGITGAASAVWNAITGAVQGAINAAKSMLGIASPSKVFADIGVNTGEGMTSGVEDSAADVQNAFADMVAPDEALDSAAAMPSAVDAPSGAAPAESSSGGGSSRSFDGATFIFQGVPGAEAAMQSFREMLLMSDEELALMAGASEAVP